MKEIEMKVTVTSDGKVFRLPAKAKAHENKLSKEANLEKLITEQPEIMDEVEGFLGHYYLDGHTSVMTRARNLLYSYHLWRNGLS